MLVSELIMELESKLENPRFKEEGHSAVKEIFETAIRLLKPLTGSEFSASKIVDLLRLKILPTKELGYFLELSNTNLNSLPEADKNIPTKESYSEIYYLMQGKQVSCLHSLDTTETWRWVGGGDVALYIFSEEGKEVISPILNKENPEYRIEKSMLFGAKNVSQDDEKFSLVTCVCEPGFREEYYKDPSKERLAELCKLFPVFHDTITELTPRAEKKSESVKNSQSIDKGFFSSKQEVVEPIEGTRPKTKHSCLIL